MCRGHSPCFSNAVFFVAESSSLAESPDFLSLIGPPRTNDQQRIQFLSGRSGARCAYRSTLCLQTVRPLRLILISQTPELINRSGGGGGGKPARVNERTNEPHSRFTINFKVKRYGTYGTRCYSFTVPTIAKEENLIRQSGFRSSGVCVVCRH